MGVGVERRPGNQKQILSVNDGGDEEVLRCSKRWGLGMTWALKTHGFCKRREEIIGLRGVMNWTHSGEGEGILSSPGPDAHGGRGRTTSH